MSMEMDQLVQLILNGTGETLYMTLISTAIAYVVGLPLGVLLVITEKGHIRPNPYFNSVVIRVPTPGQETTSNQPPCRSAIHLAMARPRPVPPVWRARLSSVR